MHGRAKRWVGGEGGGGGGSLTRRESEDSTQRRRKMGEAKGRQGPQGAPHASRVSSMHHVCRLAQRVAAASR